MKKKRCSAFFMFVVYQHMSSRAMQYANDAQYRLKQHGAKGMPSYFWQILSHNFNISIFYIKKYYNNSNNNNYYFYHCYDDYYYYYYYFLKLLFHHHHHYYRCHIHHRHYLCSGCFRVSTGKKGEKERGKQG